MVKVVCVMFVTTNWMKIIDSFGRSWFAKKPCLVRVICIYVLYRSSDGTIP